MGLVSAAKAVKKFYTAPMQSKRSSKAICIFVFAIIVAVAIVVAYCHKKGANKLFMKDGLIGRQFHNNAAWKAIVVSVASGLAVLGLTYTFIATGYHIKHKKKAEKSGEPETESAPLPPGWRLISKKDEIPYYWNDDLKVADWSRPTI